MYNNLIYFLVVIFLYSFTSVPEESFLPFYLSVPLFFLLVLAYRFFCRKVLQNIAVVSSASSYSIVEKRLSIFAIIFYAVSLYLCDVKYHLHLFSLGRHIPAVSAVLGLAVFLLLLTVMWWESSVYYNRIFSTSLSRKSFVINQIRSNLPIVLPWLMFSFANDLLRLLPFTQLQDILTSVWGDFLFFLVFFLFLLTFMPPLVQRLWNCQPLPPGDLRDQLDEFCSRQNFSAQYFIWPLMEGRAITAGVMGIVPGIRYILLTPAIIQTMSREELEAVIAHEIGHVKKAHILLYLTIILGFSLFAGLLAEPFFYSVLSLDILIKVMVEQLLSAEVVLSLVGGVPLLILMVVYFRFLFGYFMRNFERQADLYTIGVMGSAQPLISSFEKIATVTGASKSETNWHHFGLGERIACLAAADYDRSRIADHDRKVTLSLVGYFLVLAMTVGLSFQFSAEEMEHAYKEKYTEYALFYSAEQEPDNPLWQRLIGDMMYSRKLEAEAEEAYRRALAIDSSDPVALNNLAWLLLTTKDPERRNPKEALDLARSAAALAPESFVLDTLATAYWANGFVDLAVRTELAALKKDPKKAAYYKLRLELFQRQSYKDSFKDG